MLITIIILHILIIIIRIFWSIFSEKLIPYLTTIAAFIAVSLWLEGLDQHKASLTNVGVWVAYQKYEASWGLNIDFLTATMLVVVTVISSAVQIYSSTYMENDVDLPKFSAYVAIFTVFMLILVTGDNILMVFLGWEGVGLSSYLLISFWNTRIKANRAAIKALVINRISDIALTIGIVVLYYIYKNVDFKVWLIGISYLTSINVEWLSTEWDMNTILSTLFFLGAMGKSAQIGLHTWLPDAMEGPTPVSALIHAATMVTAGVFLIIKCSPLFEFVPITLTKITLIGSATAFFAATIGLVQNDIKKVIAYSTCSQLGYMVFACGLSHYDTSLFHLTNHAFFKALLFLSSGAIIHSLSNEQDMRKFGNLGSRLPFTNIMLFIGSLALMGFPFLTGFYSKDFILELALQSYTLAGSMSFGLGLIAALCTSFYSLRVILMTFVNYINTFIKTVKKLKEVPTRMSIGMLLCGVPTINVGYTTKETYVGGGTTTQKSCIYITPEFCSTLDAEFSGVNDVTELPTIALTHPNIFIKLLPFILCLLCIAFICGLLNRNMSIKESEAKLNYWNERYLSFCKQETTQQVANSKYLWEGGINKSFESILLKIDQKFKQELKEGLIQSWFVKRSLEFLETKCAIPLRNKLNFVRRESDLEVIYKDLIDNTVLMASEIATSIQVILTSLLKWLRRQLVRTIPALSIYRKVIRFEAKQIEKGKEEARTNKVRYSMQADYNIIKRNLTIFKLRDIKKFMTKLAELVIDLANWLHFVFSQELQKVHIFLQEWISQENIQGNTPWQTLSNIINYNLIYTAFWKRFKKIEFDTTAPKLWKETFSGNSPKTLNDIVVIVSLYKTFTKFKEDTNVSIDKIEKEVRKYLLEVQDTMRDWLLRTVDNVYPGSAGDLVIVYNLRVIINLITWLIDYLLVKWNNLTKHTTFIKIVACSCSVINKVFAKYLSTHDGNDPVVPGDLILIENYSKFLNFYDEKLYIICLIPYKITSIWVWKAGIETDLIIVKNLPFISYIGEKLIKIVPIIIYIIEWLVLNWYELIEAIIAIVIIVAAIPIAFSREFLIKLNIYDNFVSAFDWLAEFITIYLIYIRHAVEWYLNPDIQEDIYIIYMLFVVLFLDVSRIIYWKLNIVWVAGLTWYKDLSVFGWIVMLTYLIWLSALYWFVWWVNFIFKYKLIAWTWVIFWIVMILFVELVEILCNYIIKWQLIGWTIFVILCIPYFNILWFENIKAGWLCWMLRKITLCFVEGLQNLVKIIEKNNIISLISALMIFIFYSYVVEFLLKKPRDSWNKFKAPQERQARVNNFNKTTKGSIQLIVVCCVSSITVLLKALHDVFLGPLLNVWLNWNKEELLTTIYKFLINKWNFDNIYNSLITKPLLKLGYTIYKVIDNGLLKIVGPHGIKYLLGKFVTQMKLMQIGKPNYQTYFIVMSLILCLLVIVYFKS